MSQNSKVMSITVRQAKAIPVIIGAKSVEAGCSQAGISKTLFYGWMKTPVFADEYRRQRDILVDEAMDSLRASLKKAVNTLTTLLDTDNESLRRAVSNDILNHVLKIKEMQEIENRLSKIEQLMEER